MSALPQSTTTTHVVPLRRKVPFPSIDIKYSALEREGFQRRAGQEELSQKVRNALVVGKTICAEAATGTGKTFAYIIGALAAQEDNSLPIVISTATVALQEQIYRKDLPALQAAGIPGVAKPVLSKGRGRYFCSAQARNNLADVPDMVQIGLFDPGESDVEARQLAGKMLDAFDRKEWDGDRDNWKGRFPQKIWPLLRADRETCAGHTCPEFHDCPFYLDRIRLEGASIVVANHALTLSDLRLRAEGQTPVFPFDEYMLIVDEAHHLPEVAREQGRGEARVSTSPQLFQKLAQWVQMVRDSGISVDPAWAPAQSSALQSCMRLETLAETLNLELGDWHRFVQGETLSKDWIQTLETALKSVEDLGGMVDSIDKKLRQKMHSGKGNPTVSLGKGVIRDLRSLQQGLHRFLQKDSYLGETARWVAREPGAGYVLCSKPLSGDTLLSLLVWSQNVRSVLVSATLRAMGNFQAYAEAAGLPVDTDYHVVPPLLPYENSRLILPRLPYSPNEPEYEEALPNWLERVIDPKEGTLVLFTNERLMRETVDRLPESLRKRCLVQGKGATPALLDIHRNRIQVGQGSILIGLQSFSEGLDLPGDLCSHVVLTRIPFGYPADPVEQARAERLGSDYFRKVALPETSRRLVQSVGRLIRRESDQGRITCLDRRLRDTWYGQALLKDLPPFKVQYRLTQTRNVSA
jgi:ATP-dependent DNA helicase DinG